jgi:localization factor PodJL
MKRVILYVVLGCIAVGVVVFFAQENNESQTEATVPVQNEAPPVDLEALKAKAESGDPTAQTELGWVYQKGTGVKPDMKEAVKWFQKAADQDYPAGLSALGEMTQAGQGVKANPARAAKLYRTAAEKGNAEGQYNLAYLYEQGIGVEKSETNAAKWYELAAEGGDPDAQYDIGQRYLHGIGVPINLVQALKWLTLAANQGQSDSAQMLPDLKSKMSSDEIAKASRLVEEFVPRKSKSATQDINP